jgi:ribonuclease HII
MEMELKLKYDSGTEIGTDEVGRGCCAGPVVAAAVILGDNFKYDGIRDSKKMTEKARDKAYEFLTAEDNDMVIGYGIGVVSPSKIDEMNILNASIKAMHLAIDSLSMWHDSVSLIVSDGNQFKPYGNIPHVTVVKGDDKYLHIAAASVIAKVYRDRLMTKLGEQFPQYLWENNKGYGTEAHLQAIADYGYTVHHRRSFSLKLPPGKKVLI